MHLSSLAMLWDTKDICTHMAKATEILGKPSSSPVPQCSKWQQTLTWRQPLPLLQIGALSWVSVRFYQLLLENRLQNTICWEERREFFPKVGSYSCPNALLVKTSFSTRYSSDLLQLVKSCWYHAFHEKNTKIPKYVKFFNAFCFVLCLFVWWKYLMTRTLLNYVKQYCALLVICRLVVWLHVI